MNYKEDLKIDKNSLDENLIGQAELTMKYGELWAQKTKERDRAKENLAVVDSEQDTFARKNWASLTDVKMTEKSAASFVLKSKEHKEAFNTLLDLNEEVNILSVARIAFEHRKKALENLVSLHISGYWAEPKVAKSGMDDIKSEEIKDKTHEMVSKSPRVNKLRKRVK